MRPSASSFVVLWALTLPSTRAAAQEQPDPRRDEPRGDERTPEADDRVTVTAFMFSNGQTSAPAAVAVTASLRRGLLDNDELEYRDPSDAMSTALHQQGADAAVALLREARALVDRGAYAEAMPRLREALERFEQNLALIRKRDLTDALMLLGVVQCAGRRRSEGIETFLRVLVFRESLEYDVQRYPAIAASAFQEARQRLRRIGRGSIEVRTDPEGAEVFVDGRSRGASPVVVEGLRVGEHYLTIKLPGYEKTTGRVRVEPSFQQTYDYSLERSDQYVVLQQALAGVPAEIGEQRAGRAIRELRGVLFVDQVVLGTIRNRHGQLALDICLYDLRTGLRLKQLRRVARLRDPSTLATLARDLYDGVDLRGFVEAPPPPPPPPPPPSPSVFTKWWFWSIVGVVITGAAVTIVAAPELSPEIPEGTTRIAPRF